MVQAIARVVARASPLVAAFALAAGVAGYLAPRFWVTPASAAALEAEGGDLQLIDTVLVRRAPELGLQLRRRVAIAIVEESKRAELDPLFILGLIKIESDFAWDAVSLAGARGLMQLRPQTLEYLAASEGLKLSVEEIWRDPALQVRLGVRYLARLERRFRDPDLALMAYNAGPQKLRQALLQGDTERYRNYVRVVRRNYALFRRDLELFGEPILAQADAPVGAPGRQAP